MNSIEKEQNRDRAYFSSQGVDAGFVAQMFQAPPNQMWFPDHQTLARAGVTTIETFQ